MAEGFPLHPAAADDACPYRCRDRLGRVGDTGAPSGPDAQPAADPWSQGRNAPSAQPSPRHLDEVLEGLRPGDHVALLAPQGGAGPEWIAALVDHGLRDGARVVLLTGREDPRRVREALETRRRSRGSGRLNGEFTVTSGPEVFFCTGRFDSERFLAFVDAEIEMARAAGYEALWLVTDMSWALDRVRDWDVLAAYEEALHERVRERPCVAICQYDDRLIQSRILPGFLRCHPRWLGRLARSH